MNPQNDAQGLAGFGRYGDSTLVHMQPQEVAGLQALAQSQGTSLTTNPVTGLPEAFNIGNFLAALAPTAAGFLVGGPAGALAGSKLSATAAPIIAGAATGAIIAKAKGEDPLMGGFMGGIGGYGGGNLATSAAKFAPNAATNTTQTAFQAGVPGASYLPPTTAEIGGANLTSQVGSAGQVNPYMQPAQMNSPMADLVSRPADIGTSVQPTGFESNVQNIASDPLGFVKENPFGVGSPLAMSALAGMTPDGMPINKNEDKYDPYARLNLGGGSSQGESGLRLLAAGGPVSFAEGGSPALQGGGSAAMQGAGSMQGGGLGAMQGGGKSELGLFADQSMIDAARAEQEAAKNQIYNPQSYIGMGGMNQPYRGMGGMNYQHPGMASGLGSGMGSGLGGLLDNTNSNDSLNLGRQVSIKLANGGTIQSGGTQDLYGTRDDNMTGPALSRDGYGLGRLNSMVQGGMAGYKKGGYLDGPGDGMSDSIHATIEGKQPARLADGEFVIPADVVSHLGNGSTKAGSKRLYAMLDKVRQARTGNKKQGKQINPNKFMPT